MRGLKLVTCKELKSTNKEILLIFHLRVVIKAETLLCSSVFLPMQLLFLFKNAFVMIKYSVIKPL